MTKCPHTQEDGMCASTFFAPEKVTISIEENNGGVYVDFGKMLVLYFQTPDLFKAWMTVLFEKAKPIIRNKLVAMESMNLIRTGTNDEG